MESQAYVEADIERLIDTGLSFIPADSVIARMIGDIREWRTRESDWRAAFGLLAANYGYDRYGGNCHMVPNHGLMILSLLYGDDDFQKTLMIVNTCGWDTDCNSGNIGCLMGIKNGLAGIEAGPDWRGPVADRLFLPTADGGRAVTDAVTETFHIVNVGRALADEAALSPKGGARFHFELPGAVQGFRPEESIESQGTVVVENAVGHSQRGTRSLALHYNHVAPGRCARVATATFTPPEAAAMKGYTLLASPTIYPGQVVRAAIAADGGNEAPVTCRLYIRSYGTDDVTASAAKPPPDPIDLYYKRAHLAEDELVMTPGPATVLDPGGRHEFEWPLTGTGSAPIAQIGVEISANARVDGTVYLDYLTWDGTPNVRLTRPAAGGTMWRRAWVDGVDHYIPRYSEPFRLVQDYGTGLLIQGAREWADYRVSADVRPHMAKAAGIAARVQGMRRYYALLLCGDGTARLVKVLDGNSVLAETEFALDLGTRYELSLEVVGTRLRAWIDDQLKFDVTDDAMPLVSGAIALVCEEGRTATEVVQVRPAE
jgi:hypothetical protein